MAVKFNRKVEIINRVNGQANCSPFFTISFNFECKLKQEYPPNT